MISFQSIIDEYLARKDKEKEKKEIVSWHISGLGGCMRGMYLARLGYKPDKEFDSRDLRIFNIGNIVERWFVERLKDNGKYDVETQVRVHDEKLGISGYIDAIITDKETGEKTVLEVKSKNSRAFWYMINQKQGANRQHEIQLWTYLYLSGVKNGGLVYVSKDDMVIEQFMVQRNNVLLKEETLKIINTLNDALKTNIPPPAAEAKSWQARFCRFHKQCLKVV